MKPLKILICSIFRDSEKNIPKYYNQLMDLVRGTENVSFYYSAYENDSLDDTYSSLLSKDFSSFIDYSIKSETLLTKKYGSSTDKQRVINLANARNKATFSEDFYLNCDYLLFIESDVEYNSNILNNLISFATEYDADIVSPACIASGPTKLVCRDIWATRRTSGEEWGQFFPNCSTRQHDIYYSTFGGFCLYKMGPFIEDKIVWSAFNKRLSKYDCDTAVICEEFHRLKRHRIFIMYDNIIKHHKKGFI